MRPERDRIHRHAGRAARANFSLGRGLGAQARVDSSSPGWPVTPVSEIRTSLPPTALSLIVSLRLIRTWRTTSVSLALPVTTAPPIR